MLRFALYISDHGYGHATRMAALAEHFIRFGIFVHVRSRRPDFIFQNLNRNYFFKDDVACDVGVIHGLDLVPDLPATRSALFELMGRRLDIVEREVGFLRRERIDLIVADIPWLAVEAGTYARVPVFAISNFDWLFIYERLFCKDKELRPLLNTIHGLYHRVTHAFRLPLSSPQSMGAFPRIEKTGLLAAWQDDYTDPRHSLGLETGTPLLACTFGGEGDMRLDMKKLCAAYPGHVVSTRPQDGIDNHVQLPKEIDFSALIRGADLLLTKPGYSSFAEALQAGTHILYHPRQAYPEEDILIKGLGKYPRQTRLDTLDLTVSEWKRAFKTALLQGKAVRKVKNRNAEVAALIIRRYMELVYPGEKLRSVFDTGTNNLNYALCREGESLPIHTAQISTGLGRDYKLLPSGKAWISRKSIKSFQQNVARFLIYDRGINSCKQVLATGIHRCLEESAQLEKWFSSKWQITYQVLSGSQELELARLAASSLISNEENAIVIDIGGFSTEIVFTDCEHRRGHSLDLGLLVLKKARDEGRDWGKLISDELAKIDHPKPDKVVCIGLAATFLAKVVKQIDKYDPDLIHGCKISKKELHGLLDALKGPRRESIMLYSMEPESADILEISASYFTLLLDKFEASEFIVCHYGISSGYNLYKSKYGKRKAPSKTVV